MSALRPLGLFLILPIFSMYTHGLRGAVRHPMIIGVVLGSFHSASSIDRLSAPNIEHLFIGLQAWQPIDTTS